jgi:methyl-accepting chemotaxis protein
MRSFADLRLIWKIALPAAFLTAIAAFVAWLALGALSSTNSIADRILDKNVNKALLADVASFNINSVGVDSRDMILQRQEADKETSEARYNADIVATGSALNSLDALETDASRKADLAQIRTLVRKLQQKESTVIGLAYANKTEDAYAFVAHQAYPVYRQLRDRLDAIVSAEQAEVVSERANLKAIVAGSRIRVLVVAVLGFLVGIGILGAIALFQVARPIGRVTAALKELADGNLEIVVDGLNRTDEVGTLANALQVFNNPQSMSASAPRKLSKPNARAPRKRSMSSRRSARGSMPLPRAI